MREILFRALTANVNGLPNYNAYWVYGLLENSGAKEYPYMIAGCFVDPETVGQFTGREDAYINGTEVYDGDIIENCDTKALQIVYWNEDEAAWYCRYVEDEKRIVSLSDSLGNLNKVVGNIHENPEKLI